MTYNEQLKLIKEQANINNTWSAQQAQKQMDYQTKMSNTAHQREMADLKAAGLNPVLAANSGASTPSGAMGSTDETSTGAIAGLMQEMMVQESANARAAIKAATAAASAAKTASYTNFRSLQNSEEELLWEFLKAMSGNGDKSPKEIAEDAARGVQQLYETGKAAAQAAARQVQAAATGAKSWFTKTIVDPIKLGFANRSADAKPGSVAYKAPVTKYGAHGFVSRQKY